MCHYVIKDSDLIYSQERLSVMVQMQINTQCTQEREKLWRKLMKQHIFRFEWVSFFTLALDSLWLQLKLHFLVNFLDYCLLRSTLPFFTVHQSSVISTWYLQCIDPCISLQCSLQAYPGKVLKKLSWAQKTKFNSAYLDEKSMFP